MSYPRCFTTRSRWRSQVGAWLVLGWLALGTASVARAQASYSDTSSRQPAVPPSSALPWVVGLLVGVGLGLAGARLLSKKPRQPPSGLTVAPEPVVKPVARNVPRENRETSQPPVASGQGRQPGKSSSRNESVQERLLRKEMEKKWDENHQLPIPPQRSQDLAENRPKAVRKASTALPPKPAKTPPMNQNSPTPNPNQLLSPGQTVELSPVPSGSESMDAMALSVPGEVASASGGPLHFYAPAPDVPSIEHRKLSPNPLPQMPLLVTLPHAEATTAQFSFSPQADQSRIIGNGVRELKEFFAFELPPTEQFTTITNLAVGKLEKRDDTWHVVEKAEIALS